MAKRGGKSGRKYVRDSIGRFASKGFSGQTSGRGARLKAKGKKRDGGGAIVKPTRIGETKNTISKSSSKRKVNASSRATDRQIARDVAARSKPAAARTSKAPTNSARGQDPATGGKKSSARRKAAPKDGTDITREIGRAKGNKRIKNLNQQIKEAGTNAAGLRLEKLKVQTRMPNKPRQRVQPTAKQSAKEASRNDAIRKRSAELRAQSGRLQRNQANIQRLKAQSPKPGSRRLSSSQVRRQNRADTAKDIYSSPSAKRRAQIVGNQRGLAKTERAKNNSMKLRSDRLAEAKATGSSMIKVTRPAKPAAAKPAAKLKRSGKKIRANSLKTNKEQGRKGIVSMSSRAKAVRKGDVAKRKSERMSRIAERQSEIVARRQGRRASNYNPDGTFNQSTQTSAGSVGRSSCKKSSDLRVAVKTLHQKRYPNAVSQNAAGADLLRSLHS